MAFTWCTFDLKQIELIGAVLECPAHLHCRWEILKSQSVSQPPANISLGSRCVRQERRRRSESITWMQSDAAPIHQIMPDADRMSAAASRPPVGSAGKFEPQKKISARERWRNVTRRKTAASRLNVRARWPPIISHGTSAFNQPLAPRTHRIYRFNWLNYVQNAASNWENGILWAHTFVGNFTTEFCGSIRLEILFCVLSLINLVYFNLDYETV